MIIYQKNTILKILTFLMFSLILIVFQNCGPSVEGYTNYTLLSIDRAKNRDKWETTKFQNSALSEIQYIYSKRCYCVNYGGIITKVKNNFTEDLISVSVTPQEFIKEETSELLKMETKTISQLFDLIDQIIKQKPYSLVVEYDEQYGFPKHISVDFDQDVWDEEYSITISNLIFQNPSTATILEDPSILPKGVIFSDDFESGSLSKVIEGAKWESKTNISVVSGTSKSGEYAARFNFKASSSGDATAELRFDLAKSYPEIWIQYDLFIPSNYVHRNAEGSDNNKFFRLWDIDYNDSEKVGASMWLGSSGGSTLKADWNVNSAGIGPHGQSTALITSSDLDQWMSIKIYVKAASSATQGGTIKIWKNGVLVIDNSNAVLNFNAASSHAYRYGYLLGWSNSGFAEETNLFIDNVIFSTDEP